MSYGFNVPTSGGLGWWDTSYDVSAPGGSKAADVAADTTSSQNDGWSGVWKSIAQNVVNYAIAKDAAKDGAAWQNNTPTGQPVYVQQPAQAGIPPVLLLVGLGALVYMAVKD